MATQLEIAEHLGLSERMVRKLVSQGIIPHASRKPLDLDAARLSYIRHLRARATGGPKTKITDADDCAAEGLDLTAQRAALAKAQREHVELKSGAMRRDLLPRDDVIRAVTVCFQHVRDKLTGLPTKLAPQLARMSAASDVRAALAREVDEALSELAEQKVIAKAEGDSHVA